jgi:AcrR family transcriptional regulator
MDRRMRAGTRRGKRTARVPRPDRRKRILEAASRVFVRRGYSAARVRDVAREAGVARGTFYAHFDSKRHVLEVLARGWLDALLPPETAGAVVDAQSLDAALRALHGDVLSAFARERDRVRLLYGDEAARGPGLARVLEAHEREWRRRIGIPVVLGKASGFLRADVDVERTSECVLGMVAHVARRLAAGTDPEVVPAWVDTLVRVHRAAVS